MSTVALWQLVRDWLPTAGWEILEVREPFTHTDTNGNTSEVPAFIVADVVKYKHIRGPNQDHPMDKMCMIKDNEVLFFDKGVWDYSIKASSPDFFNDLDQILVTLFAMSEWWQIKTGRVVCKDKERIWPK